MRWRSGGRMAGRGHRGRARRHSESDVSVPKASREKTSEPERKLAVCSRRAAISTVDTGADADAAQASTGVHVHMPIYLSPSPSPSPSRLPTLRFHCSCPLPELLVGSLRFPRAHPPSLSLALAPRPLKRWVSPIAYAYPLHHLHAGG